VRRPALTTLCVAALAAGAVAGTAPAVAAPAPQAHETAAAAVPDELLVGYVAGATAADRDRARGRASAQRQERVVAAAADRTEVELVRIPQGKNREQAIRELQADPSVAYAEPNWVLQHQAATDPYFTNGSLWGMTGETAAAAGQFGSQAAKAWAATQTGSKSVYVGVIDEGIQTTHPDLDANIWTNPFDAADGVDNDRNGYVDDINGWDFDGNNSSVYDGGTRGSVDDHGTHVAGTIGAEANNGAGVVGVNWNVTMISGKFLGRRGGTAANSIKAIDYFTDLKKRHALNIVATNNSWGGGGFSQGVLDAITRADAANILFIAAAGNGGSDQVSDDNDRFASYPSNYNVPNVIAVAAIDKHGALGTFSNYGVNSVDLGAPGVAVWSTTAFNTYSSYNGTSMATPHVTGAAALYASAHPDATAAQIKNALLSSAVPTASLSGRTVTGGRLDAHGALAK
jgi:subtilisin family serine protease